MTTYVAKAAERLLFSSRVTRTKPRFAKTVSHNGLCYSFGNAKDGAYPLELYIALRLELQRFAIVFIQDTTKEVWFGVFNNTTRPTVIIPSSLFLMHLLRYKETVSEEIAIVNDVVDAGVEYLIIEKDHRLMDPDQRLKAIMKYSAAGVSAVLLCAGILQEENKLAERLLSAQERKNILSKEAERLIPAKNTTHITSLDAKQDYFVSILKNDSTGRSPLILNGVGQWR